MANIVITEGRMWVACGGGLEWSGDGAVDLSLFFLLILGAARNALRSYSTGWLCIKDSRTAKYSPVAFLHGFHVSTYTNTRFASSSIGTDCMGRKIITIMERTPQNYSVHFQSEFHVGRYINTSFTWISISTDPTCCRIVTIKYSKYRTKSFSTFPS